MNIAVLITCHNRREKTLRGLRSLVRAGEKKVKGRGEGDEWNVDVFLVDDGSTDGTSEAVRKEVEKAGGRWTVHLIQGDGTLYWAKGMALAWREALKYEGERSRSSTSTFNFDSFLWLNDDVELLEDAFEVLFGAQCPAGAVVAGACCDESGRVSYGATNERNRLIEPDGTYRAAHGWFSGNVVVVPREVCGRVGIIDGAYSHARADFDYAERLKRAQIPFCVTPRFVGRCSSDWALKMSGKGFGARLAMLWRPGYFNLHDLWLIRSRYHGIGSAVVSCGHLILMVLRGVR